MQWPIDLPAQIRKARCRRQIEQAGACQMVVYNHVGHCEQGLSSTRQEPGITRPGSDQVDFSRTLTASSFARPLDGVSNSEVTCFAGR